MVNQAEFLATSLCPCKSKLPYCDCCQPFHNTTKTPDTAEQLMRSRYTAFVLRKVDYIIATTVPAQQALLDKQAIADWAKETDWAGLEVLNFNPKLDKNHASVAFKAFFNQVQNGGSKRLFHHELSYFVKIGKETQATWYFLTPRLK